MEQDVELLTELVQSLTNDVAELKKMVANQSPPTTVLDAKSSLEKVANAINGLRNDIQAVKSQPPTAAPVDLRPQLDALSQQIRQRPEYRLSHYVRYGGYMFGLLVILLAGVTWLALDWKQERDQYAPAYEAVNWRMRYIKQADPTFYAHVEGLFAKEAPKVQQWTLEQEQADQKRDLARQAAEQAKAMNAQADQLEGKTTGKKKANR